MTSAGGERIDGVRLCLTSSQTPVQAVDVSVELLRCSTSFAALKTIARPYIERCVATIPSTVIFDEWLRDMFLETTKSVGPLGRFRLL